MAIWLGEDTGPPSILTGTWLIGPRAISTRAYFSRPTKYFIKELFILTLLQEQDQDQDQARKTKTTLDSLFPLLHTKEDE